MLNYVFSFLVGFCLFIFGVTFGHYKYPPFSLLKEFKDSFSQVPESKINQSFEVCELPVVNHVLYESHAFIGHAYGAPSEAKETDYLALNVLRFVQKNKHNLKSISFTGDVFSVPSLEKWKRLSKELNDSQKIFIAPGNHDVARLDSLDVYNLSPFGVVSFPFLERLDDVPVVYDDSVSSNWLISSETLELVNSLSSQSVIIARHNIPVVELKHLANSSAGMSSELPDLNDFVKRFSSDVSYTWLLGDSGAFPQLPRLSCIHYSNHTFIANGIGEVLGDSVVLYKDGQFYSYEL